MFHRVAAFVLGALLLGATSTDIQSVVSLPRAHLFLGIVVLGQNVELRNGYLIASPLLKGSYDTNGLPSWDELPASAPNPNDTTTQQLRATVDAIERLGFRASAISAWTVRAPSPGINQTSLQIGELLVDLGPSGIASASLARFSNRAADPFADVPANVRFSDVYIRPDCRTFANTMARIVAPEAHRRAEAIAATIGERAQLLGTTITAYTLCTYPRPQMKHVQATAPQLFVPGDYAAIPKARVGFALSPAQRARGRSARGRWVRTLAESGESVASAVPDVALLIFRSVPQAPDATDGRAVADKLQPQLDRVLVASGVRANDVFETSQRDGLGDHIFEVDVRIRSIRPRRVTQLEAAVYPVFNSVLGAGEAYGGQQALFVRDCAPLERSALQVAIRRSRSKALAIAASLHETIGTMTAFSDSGPWRTNAICGLGRDAKLSTLAASARFWNPLRVMLDDDSNGIRAEFTETINATWAMSIAN